MPTLARKTPASSCNDGDIYLSALGDRVRNARARRGMTRRGLAADSGLSERFLAQLEAGEGNISIIRLRQVAAAMNLSLGDLVRDEPARPVELSLIAELLYRLGPAELREAHQLLAARFGAVPAAERTGRIALVGLRGAGKSALGTRLAEHLGVPYVRIADCIERMAGMSLDQVFSLSGQAAYRRYERRCLEQIVADHPRAVIETSGGLVSEPGTLALLLDTCFTVWVNATPEEHMARVAAQGDMRPMAGNSEAMDDLRRILTERTPLYERADATIDTAGRTVDQSFADLLDLAPPADTTALLRTS
ncbi:MAG: helix-turn-helix transcriptional regulator [Rhodospirillales bacterium]|nr:helix-turn-helix transcriptional regulator [Rhodospirillales bacterium]